MVDIGAEVVFTIIAGLASLLAGVLASSKLFRKRARYLTGRQKISEKPYRERLAELTTSLTKASEEVDAVLSELAQVARTRESAVRRLEVDLQTLETREKELQEKIEALESTPLPAADHFVELLKLAEERSSKRDYMLFGAGVVVTTGIGIIIRLVAG